jgi:hypothetical protein
VRDDPFVKVLRQVGDRKADPRVVVLVAHGLIELMINTLVDHSCRNAKTITSDTRGYPYSTKLIILHEKGVLPDPFFETLERFRRLRNDAAHHPFFDVDANRIRQIAEPMEKHLPPAWGERFTYPSDTLNDFCGYLVHSLFSQFQGVLLPIFLPSAHKALNEQQSNAS